MDVQDLKREQLKLAQKVELRDGFSSLKTIGGTACVALPPNKLLAVVVVCSYPSLELLEWKIFVLSDPLPYQPGYMAYREMPAIIEAYNLLEQEPDLLLVPGAGIAHPRRCGMASHLGLALNKPTIGILQKLLLGKVEQGKILIQNEMVGFEVRTKEHALPLYISPGHLVSFGSALRVVSETLRPPHKMPEPLHIARKIAKKEGEKMSKVNM